MKRIQTFESFLNESRINERRISFRGKTTNDLYRIVKNDPNSMVFANGKLYSVEPENMRHDLKSPYILGVGEDGEDYDIEVSDIEFIEINESSTSKGKTKNTKT